jgi:hypothetical protein
MILDSCSQFPEKSIKNQMLEKRMLEKRMLEYKLTSHANGKVIE